MRLVLLFFSVFLIHFALPAEAGLYCQRKFDALEELRVSSFDKAVQAGSRSSCLKVAENFLKEAGDPPRNCKDARAMINDWADSYQSDTQKKLPSDPTQAYASIKAWAYQTLKTKCNKREFD